MGGASGSPSITLPLAHDGMRNMDLHHYRQREQAERMQARQAGSEAGRAAHLELADSYRAVIEAYERLEALRTKPRSVA